MNSKEARKKMRDGFFVSCKRGWSYFYYERKYYSLRWQQDFSPRFVEHIKATTIPNSNNWSAFIPYDTQEDLVKEIE